MTLALKLATFVSNIFRSERQRKPPALTASSNKRKAFVSPDMKEHQSPMIAKSILLMRTWKTNTQINDDTGNPCVSVCVFFLQFLIWNLTSLCHLKVVLSVFLLQCSAVALKIKIICLSGCLLLRPWSQDWRLRGWLTKARRNAWHEDTSSFYPSSKFPHFGVHWRINRLRCTLFLCDVKCWTHAFFLFFSSSIIFPDALRCVLTNKKKTKSI